jgi:hypothetical protein
MVPNRKRRCYQRRSGAPTRGTGPLRLALAGATRSGSAGVGSPGSRSVGEATPHPRAVNWNDNLILGQRLSPIATSQHRRNPSVAGRGERAKAAREGLAIGTS